MDIGKNNGAYNMIICINLCIEYNLFNDCYIGHSSFSRADLLSGMDINKKKMLYK